MWSSHLTKLPVRAGLSITAIALVLVATLSVFLFSQTFNNEVRRTSRSLNQLVATVQNSAAIASYLDNIEIAQEVVSGLASNDIISGVVISSKTGLNQFSGTVEKLNEEEPFRTYPLYSPFLETEQVGSITVWANRLLIEQQARKTARIEVFSLALQTLVIIAIVILFVYWQLTRPIRFIAHQLHSIIPGGRQRLKKPRWHHRDEIGGLVTDTNKLLETVSDAFEKERELRAKVESVERQFRLIFESASGGIALSSTGGSLILCNPSFRKIIGAEKVENLLSSENKSVSDLFQNPKVVREVLQQVSVQKKNVALDLKLAKDDETARARWLHCLFSPVENENGELLVESIVYDITDRTRREKLTRIEADHDALTRLLNRRAGERRLAGLLEKCRAFGHTCALLMIDLDNFKPINDTYGHDAGDKVLVEIAQRLKSATRSEDLIIRWGGDEFLVVAEEDSGVLDTASLAERILNSLAEKIDIEDGNEARVGASIGIALFPEDGRDKNTLIGLADNAMYLMKQSERRGYCFAGNIGLSERNI